ncbi:MAG: heme o synthase [Wenzhouxiangellaceae bacterium]|nr:heme o synthase [Wenzhouxiangellaceae bacterium]
MRAQERADAALAVPARPEGAGVLAPARALVATFKFRIAFAIGLSALGGAVLAGGGWPAPWQAVVLLGSVLLASFGAAGCNHYLERALDRRMRRTRNRPFASGRLSGSPGWPVLFGAMIAAGSALALVQLGIASGLFVLAGALTYVVVYTAWLKPASDWNIVIGGAAGSFGVLAGAAAAGEFMQTPVLWLALVLLLWTPSHFWALAIALVDDYRRAGLPMLPVTRGVQAAARWTMINSLLLAGATLALGWTLASPLYWLLAGTGVFWLLVTNFDLLRDPGPRAAMTAFFASLIQLGLLLAGLFVNAAVG